jgi:hypothetical protein
MDGWWRIRVATAVTVLAFAGDVWALGNVRVTTSSGKLSVIGDAGPNAIQIIPASIGAFVVIGLQGTAVNGAVSAMVSGVRKMVIETKGSRQRRAPRGRHRRIAHRDAGAATTPSSWTVAACRRRRTSPAAAVPTTFACDRAYASAASSW